ncbi:MAG: POTRA domain-containing protein, partial [Microcoleus sp.]
MRRTVNIVIFRFGVSLLSAVSIACLSANQARSQTSDLSDLPAATANSVDTGHSPLALQKPEIQQDETATDLTQLVENGEQSHNQLGSGSPIGNSQDACSTNETACGAGILAVAKQLVEKEPKCQNQLNCDFLAQNSQTPPGNIPSDLNRDRVPNPLLPPPSTRPDPNRDRFLQPAPQPEPEPPQAPPTVKPQPPAPVPQPLPSEAIPVQKIQVVGSTILSQEEINALVKPLEGRSSTLEELKQVADKITEIYLNRGYITSRAVLPPQTLTAGVVQIQVIE